MTVKYYQSNMDSLFGSGMELHQFNFGDKQAFGFISKSSDPKVLSVCKWKLKKKHEGNNNKPSTDTLGDG